MEDQNLSPQKAQPTQPPIPEHQNFIPDTKQATSQEEDPCVQQEALPQPEEAKEPARPEQPQTEKPEPAEPEPLPGQDVEMPQVPSQDREENKVQHRPRRMPQAEFEKLNAQSKTQTTTPAPIFVQCDTYQACMLNLRMPQGFKLEIDDAVLKAIHLRNVKQKQKPKAQPKPAKSAPAPKEVVEAQKPLEPMAEATPQESEANADQSLPALEKRVSQRAKQNVNYQTLSSVGQPVEASAQQQDQLTEQALKHKKFMASIKVNQDVFKKCSDFFQRVQESPQYAELFKDSQASEEMQAQFETFTAIEKSFKEFKYQATRPISIDMHKVFKAMTQAASTDSSLYNRVNEFKFATLQSFDELRLSNKEIYVTKPKQPETPPVRQPPKGGKLEKPVAPPKNVAKPPVAQKPKVKPRNETPMTKEEKQALVDKVCALTQAQKQEIVKIVTENNPKKGDNQTFEIDLNNLSVKKCRELEAYVESCTRENQKRQQKAQPRPRDKKAATKAVTQEEPRPKTSVAPPNPAVQAQAFVYDQLTVEQLSTLLYQQPNIEISEAKRQQVEQYRFQQTEAIRLAQQQIGGMSSQPAQALASQPAPTSQPAAPAVAPSQPLNQQFEFISSSDSDESDFDSMDKK